MLETNTLYLFCHNVSEEILDFNSHQPDLILDPYEQARIRKQSKAKVYYFQRFLIRQALSKLNIPLNDYAYTHNKPSLRKPHAISLTHSDSYFIIGVIQAPALGIDLQCRTPQNKTTICKKFNIDHTLSQHDFLLHWTLAESLTKCLNIPLSQTLRRPHQLKEDTNTYTIYRKHPHFFAASTTPITNTCIIDPKKHFPLW